MLQTRVKSDIPLKRVAFLLDRSWLADLADGEGKDRVTVRVRVIEYWVTVEGQDVSEMFCLITDLLDCEAYPARVLAAACRWRWDGSETGLRETRSLLDGAGPSTGPMLRSRSPLLVRQELAAWALAGELVRGLVRDAADAAAPARKGRRAGQPVHPRQLSFTAARRAAITSIRQGTAAAGLPPRSPPAPRDCSPPSDVPGTSPTGNGTAPATPKPGRHSRRHTATPRPGSPKPSWTSAARPPD